jgi:hypothetical protein
MSYDDRPHLEGCAAADGVAGDIPSAAQTAAAVGATDHPTERRPRRSRSSAMPAYEHEGLEPAQWFADRALQPEKRLMLAVLADALDLLLRPPAPPHSRRLPWQRDAARWIRSNDREWPYSFLNICEVLNLEPHRVRQSLDRILARRRAAREASPRRPIVATVARESESTTAPMDDSLTRDMREAADTREVPALEPARPSLPYVPVGYSQPWPWL